MKARKQAEAARFQVREETIKLQHAAEQLDAAREVAQLEYQLAQSSLDAAQTRSDAQQQVTVALSQTFEGKYKATGADTRQILAMYLVLIVGFGLAALLLSYPLANKAAQSIGDGMASWLNFYPATYRGYTSTLIQQGIVAVAIPVLTALWPLYNSVRITVREALSDYGIGSNAKPKDKAISKGNLLLPRPLRLSLRNAFRRKLRMALTLFTLVLAGAIMIGVFNLWGAFDKVLNDIQGYFLADINIRFDRAYRLDKVAEMALRVPGVESVEGWLEYPGTLIIDKDEAGRQVEFVAPPSNSELIDPVIGSGRWLTAGDENAVVIGNQLITMFPDLKVGDWLTIKIDGKETYFEWTNAGRYTCAGERGATLQQRTPVVADHDGLPPSR